MMIAKNKIRILHIGEQDGWLDAISGVFRKQGGEYEFASVSDAGSSIGHIERFQPDILLMSLEEYSGNVPAVRMMPKGRDSVPLLLLCAPGDISDAEDLIESDVPDYYIATDETLPGLPFAVRRTLTLWESGKEQAVREQALWEALKKKEIFLKELYHRVKNNFQTIASMLSLQSQYVEDEEIIEMFSQCQDRVRAMALIHERLQNSADLVSIDFNEYVDSLIKGLFWSYSADHRRIRTTVDVRSSNIKMDTSIICGLIINELVSNSLKYAFPAKLPGDHLISIRFDQDEQGVNTLEVQDNGIGLPENVDFYHPQTLGLQLVIIFSQDQLNGKITVDCKNGTLVRIVFKEWD
ncbi:hypothetical protein JXO52_01545 [bacterium]|nr:hypothetical protein [bacterium]